MTAKLDTRPVRTPASSRDDGRERDGLDALRYRRDLCARTLESLARRDAAESLAAMAARDVLAGVEAEVRRRETPARRDAAGS